MSQFAPEDSQGAIDFVSDGDITFESDRDQDGAGDVIFRTGGVERARIKNDGSGTGWPNVLGGSMAPVFNVKSLYGAKGDGVTDDASALQSALDAANVAGGGIVYCPTGTYLFGTTLVIYDNVLLLGAGHGATTLKLKNGADCDGINTYQFATLTGGNTPGGPSRWQIRDLTLDGNKTNNTSGNGIRIYGFAYTLENFVVRNWAQDGIYSEWSSSASTGVSTTKDQMEAGLTMVKTHHNDGDGFVWNGPHDSRIDRLFSYQNTGNGIIVGSPSSDTHFSHSTSYTNGMSAWILNQSCNLTGAIGSGSPAGYYQFDIQATGCILNDVHFFGTNAIGEAGIRVGTAATKSVGELRITGRFANFIGNIMDFEDDAGKSEIRLVGDPLSGTLTGGTKAASTIYTVAGALAPAGTELGYTQITTNINIGTASTAIITAGAVTFDGQPVMVEFFAYEVRDDTAAAGDSVIVSLYEGSTEITRLGQIVTPAAAAMGVPICLRLRYTPTAGAHTYIVKAFASSATGTPVVIAGDASGANKPPPAFVRFTKV